MKKIDNFILQSFIGPFVVIFGIATFVLVMQILWVYIDDIAGKGLGFFMILELLAYKCVGLVPMALPLAILIASVMVLGGLAERYELSSYKSAGVSLLRVMRSIIVFGAISVVFSYLTNDFIIPSANLKFGSRMHDIKEKKPAFGLEEGVFNDDFGNYSIHIEGRNKNGRDITGVLMYDHTESNSGRVSEVVADAGEMFNTPDGSSFIMRLYKGAQYTEARPSAARQGRGGGYPFVRTSFDSYTKVFDLSEFNLQVTDDQLFSQNRSMMTTFQLASRVDTIQNLVDLRYYNLAKQIHEQYPILPTDSIYRPTPYLLEQERIKNTPAATAKDSTSFMVDSRSDSLRKATLALQDSLNKAKKNGSDSIAVEKKDTLSVSSLKGKLKNTGIPPKPKPVPGTKAPIVPVTPVPKEVQRRLDSLENVLVPPKPIYLYNDSIHVVKEWLDALSATERSRIMAKAKANARAISGQVDSGEIYINSAREDKAKHIYELHTKYSMALVCLLFVFIGAPLGAIVRKGGFGYPLLVGVNAFILFIVLTILCRNIAESFILPAALAAWLPCLLLAPIALFLTYKANNDAKLLEAERLTNALRKAQEALARKGRE